jgi:hypothetical protein
VEKPLQANGSIFIWIPGRSDPLVNYCHRNPSQEPIRAQILQHILGTSGTNPKEDYRKDERKMNNSTKLSYKRSKRQ